MQFKGFLIIAIMLVLGAGGLYSFALAANGTFWLICGCLITGFLYSARTMYLVCALALAIFLANFIGYSSGLLHTQTNLDLYMQGVSSWLNFLRPAQRLERSGSHSDPTGGLAATQLVELIIWQRFNRAAANSCVWRPGSEQVPRSPVTDDCRTHFVWKCSDSGLFKGPGAPS